MIKKVRIINPHQRGYNMKRLFLIVLYIISAVLLYPIVSYVILYYFHFLEYLPEIPYQAHLQVLYSAPTLLIIGIYLIIKHKSYNRVVGIAFCSIAIIWLTILITEVIIAYP